MADVSIKDKISSLADNVRYYWKEPPKGRYMPFKEIAAYSFGGIGAYFIIQLGLTLIVSTTNTIVANAIGVLPMDVYIIYIIATILNIPLTGVRANMVDNTRGKGGKYRPYLLYMGIPTALLAVMYVWFPYEQLYYWFPGKTFNLENGYLIKCALVFIFNLALHFFFYFFQDAYTNLIHVLSPNTQERTDVLSIKSVVYSLAPSIMNIVNPLIAQYFADGKVLDLKVYRISYPIFAVIGISLTIIVYANTEEKIVQAKTHTIQIRFIDALKEVAKNKYFWIISLAGWLGFLEGAYGNILQWSQNYGHTCTGAQLSLINTLTGNASLWGMLLAPFCIRAFGKKKVLIGVNLMNVVCILMMIVNMRNIWWLFICVYFNWLFGAFEQITTPAIQADIRDYQQYRSGERIDGMFAAVTTIGNLVTLATSAVLPAVQKSYGVYSGNGYENAWDILDVDTGEPDLLYKLMGALILMAAFGAFLNVVPYFFYDFTEKKQKSVVRVLQVRALFEDYGNNALNNRQIVEAIDMVNNAREMAVSQPKQVSRDMYKSVSDKAERKSAKKAYREALNFNEEIEISKFVCNELDKFSSPAFIRQVNDYKLIYDSGLDYIKDINIASVKNDLEKAKAMPKTNEIEKENRAFAIKLCKDKISAKKNYDKYYGSVNIFAEPDMNMLMRLFDNEDELEEEIFSLTEEKAAAKKAGDKALFNDLNAQIKAINANKRSVKKEQKNLMDEFAKFNRAAKPFNDAKKLLTQEENYSHFDEIAALYDDAKVKAEEEERLKFEENRRKREEEKAELERRKAAKKMNNKR